MGLKLSMDLIDPVQVAEITRNHNTAKTLEFLSAKFMDIIKFFNKFNKFCNNFIMQHQSNVPCTGKITGRVQSATLTKVRGKNL